MSQPLHPTPYTLHLRRGFTLIEVLVVVSILTLLSSFLIVYTRSSENQIKILKDKAAFIGALYRARSLSIRTFQADPPVCGYGLRVLDEGRYVIWYDTAAAPDCKDASGNYGGDAENFERVISLANGIRFLNINDGDFLRDILFVPPDPQVVTVPGMAPAGQFRVVIGTDDGQSSAVLAINKYGQVEPSAGY